MYPKDFTSKAQVTKILSTGNTVDKMIVQVSPHSPSSGGKLPPQLQSSKNAKPLLLALGYIPSEAEDKAAWEVSCQGSVAQTQNHEANQANHTTKPTQPSQPTKPTKPTKASEPSGKQANRQPRQARQRSQTRETSQPS